MGTSLEMNVFSSLLRHSLMQYFSVTVTLMTLGPDSF
jgi:hypothetical protein